MSAEIYSAKTHQGDKETCRDNNDEASTGIRRSSQQVSGQSAVKHSSYHRVAAGKTVAGESQDRIVEMRSRTMKRIFQKPVEQRPASDG